MSVWRYCWCISTFTYRVLYTFWFQFDGDNSPKVRRLSFLYTREQISELAHTHTHTWRESIYYTHIYFGINIAKIKPHSNWNIAPKYWRHTTAETNGMEWNEIYLYRHHRYTYNQHAMRKDIVRFLLRRHNTLIFFGIIYIQERRKKNENTSILGVKKTNIHNFLFFSILFLTEMYWLTDSEHCRI